MSEQGRVHWPGRSGQIIGILASRPFAVTPKSVWKTIFIKHVLELLPTKILLQTLKFRPLTFDFPANLQISYLPIVLPIPDGFS